MAVDRVGDSLPTRALEEADLGRHPTSLLGSGDSGQARPNATQKGDQHGHRGLVAPLIVGALHNARSMPK
jgi:hypothetical protein